MYFGLTDEQIALQTATREFLDARADSAALRRLIADGSGGHDAVVWHLMAEELGLHGIHVPEEYGGAGAGYVELALVLEEMGRVLLSGPFFSTVVLATTLLLQSDDDDAKARWLPGIVEGATIATVAHRRHDGVTASATRDGDDWFLDGTAGAVDDGLLADLVFVLADTDRGRSVFAVGGDAAGLTRTGLPALDPTRTLATLSFERVPAVLIGAQGGGEAMIERLLSIARVCLAAEQLGAAAQCLDICKDFVLSRVQFDRPIGSFQAVKHRLADMYIDVATSRLAVQRASWAIAEESSEATTIAHATGAHVSAAFERVARSNVQLHGGIAIAWEHSAHLYLKRALASAVALGSVDALRQSVAKAVIAGID